MRALALFMAVLFAAPTQAETPSPYAGEDNRSIATLSKSDVAALERGAGWGLARAAEQALNDAFKAGVPDQQSLEGLVRESSEARAALRLVHLAAHLETPSLLTAHQIARYSVLRGYDNPCSTVPEGHDATMWRRHNGCEYIRACSAKNTPDRCETFMG